MPGQHRQRQRDHHAEPCRRSQALQRRHDDQDDPIDRRVRCPARTARRAPASRRTSTSSPAAVPTTDPRRPATIATNPATGGPPAPPYVPCPAVQPIVGRRRDEAAGRGAPALDLPRRTAPEFLLVGPVRRAYRPAAAAAQTRRRRPARGACPASVARSRASNSKGAVSAEREHEEDAVVDAAQELREHEHRGQDAIAHASRAARCDAGPSTPAASTATTAARGASGARRGTAAARRSSRR